MRPLISVLVNTEIGDNRSRFGDHRDIPRRRMKPACGLGVVSSGNLARLTRHRRVMRGLDQFRRRREQAPHKFPMIVVHVAPRPNFRQERFLLGGSPDE